MALLGAWFCVLMVAAPAAEADNIGPPMIDRAEGSRTVRVSHPGTWAPAAPGYSYAWFRCSNPTTVSCTRQIGGATGSSYVLRTPDIGFFIRARVTDSGSGDSAFSSDFEGPITASPPRNTVAPQVAGTPRRTFTIGATAGTWSGRVAGDPAFTFQWQRCTTASASTCANVAGARSSTYTLGHADVGRYFRVLVGAEGLGRAQVTAPARPVGPGQNLPPAPSLKRLSPFPVLVIAGRLRGRTTRLSGFVVRGPRRAKVSVRCRGKRCPYRRIRGTIGRRKRLRFRRAQRKYRAGQVLEVRVTGRNRVGKFTRITFRRGRAPRRSDLCLRPGATKPTSCSRL